MKQEEKEKQQIKIVDRVTDKALKQVERERKGKQRNYIEDWFRYVELVGNRLRRHLN